MSDDTIKRADALNALFRMDSTKIDKALAMGEIRSIPSADRPRGEWIIEIDANGNTYGRCSICGMRQYAGQLNFCPDCGARMKRVDEETETQNSNLTFEKVQTQVIEFPDTHQKFIFTRKIETHGDSVKISGWEYNGVKDED